jgi:hypothetical protein
MENKKCSKPATCENNTSSDRSQAFCHMSHMSASAIVVLKDVNDWQKNMDARK